MMDFQENMDMANQITTVLSDSLSNMDQDWNDEDMEKELQCLMEEDFYQPVEIPQLKNKMHVTFEEPLHDEPEPAAPEPVPESGSDVNENPVPANV